MAVSTSENGVKILANADGVRLIRAIESRALDPSRIPPGAVAKVYLFGGFIISLRSLFHFSFDS